MFEAILAVVGAIVGVVGGVVSAGAQKFAQRNAEYEATLKFERDKELSLYTGLSSQETAKTIIVVVGIIALFAFAFFMNKSNKK